MAYHKVLLCRMYHALRDQDAVMVAKRFLSATLQHMMEVRDEYREQADQDVGDCDPFGDGRLFDRVVWPVMTDEVKQRRIQAEIDRFTPATARRYLLAECIKGEGVEQIDRLVGEFPYLDTARKRADNVGAFVPRVPNVFVRESFSFLNLKTLKTRCSLLNRKWCDHMHYEAVAHLPDVVCNAETRFDLRRFLDELGKITLKTKLETLWLGERDAWAYRTVSAFKSIGVKATRLHTLVMGTKLADGLGVSGVLAACSRPLDLFVMYGKVAIHINKMNEVIQSPVAPRRFVHEVHVRSLRFIVARFREALNQLKLSKAACQVVHLHVPCSSGGQYVHLSHMSQMCREFARGVSSSASRFNVTVDIDPEGGSDSSEEVDTDYSTLRAFTSTSRPQVLFSTVDSDFPTGYLQPQY